MNKILKPKSKPKVAYSGKIIQVIEQDYSFGDKIITFETARRTPGTRLLIINSKNQILINKEFRKELDDWDYRLPGGKVFETLDEYIAFLETQEDIIPIAEKAAIKEANEECGIKAKRAKHIHTSTSGGSTIKWDLYFFQIDEFNETGEKQLEVGENIKNLWMSFEESKQICIDKKMNDDRSVSVLMRYLE